MGRTAELTPAGLTGIPSHVRSRLDRTTARPLGGRLQGGRLATPPDLLLAAVDRMSGVDTPIRIRRCTRHRRRTSRRSTVRRNISRPSVASRPASRSLPVVRMCLSRVIVRRSIGTRPVLSGIRSVDYRSAVTIDLPGTRTNRNPDATGTRVLGRSGGKARTGTSDPARLPAIS